MSLPVSLAEAAQRCGLKSALALRNRLAVHGGMTVRQLGRHTYYVFEDELETYLKKFRKGHLTAKGSKPNRSAQPRCRAA